MRNTYTRSYLLTRFTRASEAKAGKAAAPKAEAEATSAESSSMDESDGATDPTELNMTNVKLQSFALFESKNSSQLKLLKVLETVEALDSGKCLYSPALGGTSRESALKAAASADAETPTTSATPAVSSEETPTPTTTAVAQAEAPEDLPEVKVNMEALWNTVSACLTDMCANSTTR